MMGVVTGHAEILEPASDVQPRMCADNHVSSGRRRCRCEPARDGPSIDVRVESAFVDSESAVNWQRR